MGRCYCWRWAEMSRGLSLRSRSWKGACMEQIGLLDGR